MRPNKNVISSTGGVDYGFSQQIWIDEIARGSIASFQSHRIRWICCSGNNWPTQLSRYVDALESLLGVKAIRWYEPLQPQPVTSKRSMRTSMYWNEILTLDRRWGRNEAVYRIVSARMRNLIVCCW